jgi:hypothetical protein
VLTYAHVAVDRDDDAPTVELGLEDPAADEMPRRTFRASIGQQHLHDGIVPGDRPRAPG